MTNPPRMFPRSPLAIFLCSLALVHAAPLERQLGHGLAYVRVHELPGDLPVKPPAGRVPPCVVDVRYVHATPDAATAFLGWLKFRATLRSPIFVLANGDTSAGLLQRLALHERASGIVVVGIAAVGFHPDVAVNAAADSERRAYDALEKGTPVTKLLADNPEKVRNDEASLSRDRLAEAAADLLTGKPDTAPIDAALQRAVHLHRALVALKRIQ